MPTFGPASKKELAAVDSRLALVCHEALKYFDFSVIQGHRGKEAQDRAVAEGRSKTPWPTSKHNAFPSRAVDLAPYPQDWSDREAAHLRFAFMMGVVKVCADHLGVKVRFGMDWSRNLDPRDESFLDLPHVELDEP